MKNFLADNNQSGQALLRLVARGNSIIAELLRLADFIPPIFKMENRDENIKYGELLSDFTYFSQQETFEHKLETRMELQDKDEEFRENNVSILQRFYSAFESVHKYVTDLNRYLEDLDEGIYVHHDLVSVIMNEDGKQLLCEALYLYGVMLMTVDNKIDGLVRERMLVSYHRYSAHNSAINSNIDDVCNLMRNTGFTAVPYKRPANYPESFFSRIPINSNFVQMLIDRLRSDDIYHQCAAYPVPDHRFTALANQASMLYVILNFAPEILNNEQAKMREIVDKHFPENWVINVYMGATVNLVEAWLPYRAAKSALDNTLETGNVRLQANKHGGKVPKLLRDVAVYLKEGVLKREYVLDNINKLMGVVRECNVTMRWVMLHTAALYPGAEASKRCRQLREQVIQDSKYDAEMLFRLLLLTGQFEFRLLELIRQMLSEKEDNWNAYKKECVERMSELSDVFSGTKALTRVEKNEKLQAWFTNLGQQINNLEYTDSTSAGRKLDQLIQALREVLEFHQLESNLQVKQFLEDTCRFLQQMMRVINLKEEVLVTLQINGDLSYAWKIIDSYTVFMQRGIKKDPTLVIKLRASFLKLASALDLPLIRINQANSPDLISVSQYYSSVLVSYVRKVLQIIPETMFGKLASIIRLQTESIAEIPTRLEKDKMKDFANLDHRYTVARMTHDISVFTEGMYMMKTTLVGIIKIDPKQLLEDGIRKELVQRVCRALHDGLTFNMKARPSEISLKLDVIGEVMDGFRRSFEYIQDYVNIYGLRIWQEEVSRIINYNVEQECNNFLRTKVADWQSVYQSTTIPIPKFPPSPSDPTAASFVGRLTHELLRITDPKTTVYVEQLSTWYDARTKTEVASVKIFQKMERAIDSFGLSGIDRLISFMIVRDVQLLIYSCKSLFEKDKLFRESLESIRRQAEPFTGLLGQPGRMYAQFASKHGRHFGRLVDFLLKLGQLQLLRRQIANQLSMSCKFDSKFLASSLQALNDSLLVDICAHYKDPQKPYPKEDNTLLYELGNYLDATGMHDPVNKIYTTTRNLTFLPVLMVAVAVSTNMKMAFSKNAGSLISRRSSDALDGAPFAIGMATCLRQFHTDIQGEFMALYGQLIRSLLENIPKVKGSPFPVDAINGIAFLTNYCYYANIPSNVLSTYIPEYILDDWRSQATEQ